MAAQPKNNTDKPALIDEQAAGWQDLSETTDDFAAQVIYSSIGTIADISASSIDANTEELVIDNGAAENASPVSGFYQTNDTLTANIFTLASFTSLAWIEPAFIALDENVAAINVAEGVEEFQTDVSPKDNFFSEEPYLIDDPYFDGEYTLDETVEDIADPSDDPGTDDDFVYIDVAEGEAGEVTGDLTDGWIEEPIEDEETFYDETVDDESYMDVATETEIYPLVTDEPDISLSIYPCCNYPDFVLPEIASFFTLDSFIALSWLEPMIIAWDQTSVPINADEEVEGLPTDVFPEGNFFYEEPYIVDDPYFDGEYTLDETVEDIAYPSDDPEADDDFVYIDVVEGEAGEVTGDLTDAWIEEPIEDEETFYEETVDDESYMDVATEAEIFPLVVDEPDIIFTNYLDVVLSATDKPIFESFARPEITVSSGLPRPINLTIMDFSIFTGDINAGGNVSFSQKINPANSHKIESWEGNLELRSAQGGTIFFADNGDVAGNFSITTTGLTETSPGFIFTTP